MLFLTTIPIALFLTVVVQFIMIDGDQIMYEVMNKLVSGFVFVLYWGMIILGAASFAVLALSLVFQMMIHTPLPKGISTAQTVGNVGRTNLKKATAAIEFANNETKAIKHWQAAIRDFEEARDYLEARKWAIVKHIGDLQDG